MKYTEYELGQINIEVIDGDRGKNYPHQDELLEEGSCVFLSANNVTPSGFKFDSVVYITEEKDKILRNGKLTRNDIVITTRGTVGNVGLFDNSVPFTDMRINSGMLIVRCGEGVDYRYLYYVLRGGSFQKQILQIRTGTAQPQLPKSHFLRMKVELPPIDIQQKIAKVLGTIDEKIKNNDVINENLEQQAASYFYHQFIVNADPSWKEGTISDLGTVIGGSTPSKSKPEYYTDNGIAWITPKDLSVDKSKFISHGADDITELGLRNSSASIMPAGTVLFSSRAPIGYIAIADGEVTTNQGFKSVVPNGNVGTAFVYYFLKNALPTIENMASGSTFKEISGSAMRTVPAMIPDDGSLQEFSDFCEPLFLQQRTLEAENRSLAALRDSLLPKLMSGELDVSELDL